MEGKLVFTRGKAVIISGGKFPGRGQSGNFFVTLGMTSFGKMSRRHCKGGGILGKKNGAKYGRDDIES